MKSEFDDRLKIFATNTLWLDPTDPFLVTQLIPLPDGYGRDWMLTIGQREHTQSLICSTEHLRSIVAEINAKINNQLDKEL